MYQTLEKRRLRLGVMEEVLGVDNRREIVAIYDVGGNTVDVNKHGTMRNALRMAERGTSY